MSGQAEPFAEAADPARPAETGFEARAVFLLRLRESGIRDLGILRAMEAVPRAHFVAPAYAAMALRDIALPIPCGQSVPEPLLVARLLVGSRLHAAMRVLVIGLGSGYTAAVLSHLVAEVVAVDRFRTLVAAAAERMAAFAHGDVACRWADGLDMPDEPPFDRVIMVGAVAAIPPRLWTLVKPGGAILHARPAEDMPASRQVLAMAERPVDGIGRQTIIGPCRLTPLRPGRAVRL